MPRKSPHDVPDAFQDMPRPPWDISKAGAAFWLAFISLRPREAWTSSDLHLLRLCCEAFAAEARYAKCLEEQGEVIENRFGNKVANPYCALQAQASRRGAQMLAKLRLAPATRENSDSTERIRKYRDKATRIQQIVEGDDDGLLGGPLLN